MQPPLEIPGSIDPLVITYYYNLIGILFWPIYNETSSNQMSDDFASIQSAASSISDLIQVPGPSFFAQQRDHRYLIARLILSNIAPYSPGNELAGYQQSFNYVRRWGGTINNPNRDELWLANPVCADNAGGRYADLYIYQVEVTDSEGKVIGYEYYRNLGQPNESVATIEDFQNVILWLTNYAACRGNPPSTESAFIAAYQAITQYAVNAIEDHILGVTNPLVFQGTYGNNDYGDAQVRHANSCYFQLNGICQSGEVNIQVFCQNNPSANCRVRRRYNVVSATETSFVDLAISINQWFNYSTLPTNYTNVPPTVPLTGQPPQASSYADYLYNPTEVPQQITYETAVGSSYYLSMGNYDVNGTPTFFLMGVGVQYVPNDTRVNAFIRHWNRLNHDNIPEGFPETYTPDFCMIGASHVIWVTVYDAPGEDDLTLERWFTFVYQDVSQEQGSDRWFCTSVIP
jgi:hypothetical protein